MSVLPGKTPSAWRGRLFRYVASTRWVSVRHRFSPDFQARVRDLLERWVHRGVAFRRGQAWASASSAPAASPLCKPTPREDSAPMVSLPGVDLYGYFSRWLGLGECARLYAHAMLDAGYPVALHDVDIDIPHAKLDTSLASYIAPSTRYARDLVFVNPDHWGDVLQGMQRSSTARRHVTAYWFWELERFPEDWRHALDDVDEIMVSSEFVRSALSKICDKPITRVPLPLGCSQASGLTRAHFGLEQDSYIFFCSFDFNSSVARKNPHAVIEAFRRAFPDGNEKVTLLIKSSNGGRQVGLLTELLIHAGQDRRIIIRDDMLERPDLQALYACIDAYVSLHRCEGFGLGLAEAMCMGKPAVATAYSGNLEFMTAQNSCLVNYQMVPVGAGEYPHSSGQQWADPDPMHAAEHMRALYLDPDYGQRLGAVAARDMARDFSADACMRVLLARFGSVEDEAQPAVNYAARSMQG